MDINSEVQEYEAKISKMISEGGLGVSAYYEYDIPNKGSSKKELLEKSKLSTSNSPSDLADHS